MRYICEECGKEHGCKSINGIEGICRECYDKQRHQIILNKASESNEASFFKEWSSKDRTTAFFEAFGRYQKEPNERDLQTILQLRCWAAHADHGLSVTMSYIFDWAKFDIHNEQRKLKEQKEVN